MFLRTARLSWFSLTVCAASVAVAAAPAVPTNLPAAPATRPAEASAAAGKVVRVALYADEGSMKGGDNVEKCLNLDPGRYACKKVTAEDIRAGVLKDFDVLVQGGGSGSKCGLTLKSEGRDQIRGFVKNGGGFIGICAGAYLASSHYEWSLHILNAQVVDRAHWNRGGGTVKLNLTAGGKNQLAVDQDVIDCKYNQGPLLAPHDKADLPAYQTLATFGSEIAKNGAPTGVMVGTTAVAAAPFGQGRVIAISPHPEATKGLDNVIRRAVKWVSGEGPIAITPPAGLGTQPSASR
jgi:hypothetical protein